MYPRIFVKLFKIFVFILFISAVFSFAQNTPVQNIQNSDWVAQDGLGRSLPQYSETGGVKDRWVGVFYWLWHGSVRTNPIRDISKELALRPHNPQWVWADWWWGEPENGYYHSGDPWVARKNLTMLANAGVDFIFFDYTNGSIGHPYLEGFLQVAKDLQNQGVPVPRIVFFLNANAKATMTQVYEELYKPRKFESLWFMWKGKPLMMEHRDSANTQEIRDFFTFRDSWAFQRDTVDQWRFIDDYPQRPSWHQGQLEQMVVNKGMGAPLWPKGSIDNKGSSWTWHGDRAGTVPLRNEYWVTDSTAYGLYFNEQFNRADSIDAPMLLVTGWNEWTAGAWNADDGMANAFQFMGRDMNLDPNKWFFVDQFNMEYNRDIEPMKGGYGDSYYWQLVQRIRRYKGMPAATLASAPRTMNIEGDFADWSEVRPVFKDPALDTEHRNYRNCDNSAMLINTTGRNDIIEARVTHDATMLYFYVKTQANLTPSSDPQWMELWIDADQNAGTGWEGFEFQVEGLISGGKRSLKRWNGSSWVVVNADVFAKAQGQQMELSIAKSTLGLGAQPSFDFKWSDNVGSEGNVMSFVDHGDAAPDRRFNYRYTGLAVSETRGVYPGPDAPILPGEIELENFDRGGEGVAFHDSDPTNNGGQYRNTGVDIQAIPAGGYSLGWVNPGEWLEYTVNVAESGDYVVEVMGSSVLGKDSLEVSAILNGSKVSVGFEATGGLHNYVSQSSLISLQPGIQVIRVTITKSAGGFNLDKIQFLKYDPPVAIPLRPAHKQQFNPSLLNIDGLGRRVHGKNQNIVIYNK